MKSSNSRMVAGVLAIAGLFTVLAYGMMSKRGPEPPAEPQAARPANTSPFNADRAFADLRAMVDFGPRPAGSDALAKTRAYVVSELQKAGLKAELDDFEP